MVRSIGSPLSEMAGFIECHKKQLDRLAAEIDLRILKRTSPPIAAVVPTSEWSESSRDC